MHTRRELDEGTLNRNASGLEGAREGGQSSQGGAAVRSHYPFPQKARFQSEGAGARTQQGKERPRMGAKAGGRGSLNLARGRRSSAGGHSPHTLTPPSLGSPATASWVSGSHVQGNPGNVPERSPPGAQSQAEKGGARIDLRNLSKDPSSSDIGGFDELLLIILLFPNRFASEWPIKNSLPFSRVSALK